MRSRAPAVDILAGGERRFFRTSKILVNFSELLNHVLTQREVIRNSRSSMPERSADRENQSNRCRNNRAVGDRRADFSSFFFPPFSAFLHLCSELQSEWMDVYRSFLKQKVGTDTANARSGISLFPRVLRLCKARNTAQKDTKRGENQGKKTRGAFLSP